jgi:hypothetical protein
MQHLISLDDIKINIPYILFRYMCTAFTIKNYSLSYFSFIYRIVRYHLVNLPLKISDKLILSANLYDELINLRWQRIVDNDRPIMVPEPKSISGWIFAPDVLPNQYWDSTDPVPEAIIAPPSTFHQASSS